LKVDAPANADRLIAPLEQDRRFLLTASREPEYYASSGRVYAVVGQMGPLISLIVTVGAGVILGGLLLSPLVGAVGGLLPARNASRAVNRRRAAARVRSILLLDNASLPL
jgi:hypothetical protein